MDTRNDAAELSLYKRLGGYDLIAAIVDDLFSQMRADARFSRFAVGRSIDSRRRSQQLTVDLICSLSSGTCYYIGRDMKTSHAGLAITEGEWEALLELTRKALHNHGIGGREQAEFLSMFERYKGDICRGSQRAAGRMIADDRSHQMVPSSLPNHPRSAPLAGYLRASLRYDYPQAGPWLQVRNARHTSRWIACP